MRADPIGINGGINLFSYANSNPLNSMDPQGLSVKCVKWRTIYEDWVETHAKEYWVLVGTHQPVPSYPGTCQYSKYREGEMMRWYNKLERCWDSCKKEHFIRIAEVGFQTKEFKKVVDTDMTTMMLFWSLDGFSFYGCDRDYRNMFFPNKPN